MATMNQGTLQQHSGALETELDVRELHHPPRPAGVVNIAPNGIGATPRSAYDFGGSTPCADAYKVYFSGPAGSTQWVVLTNDNPNLYSLASIGAGSVPTDNGMLYTFQNGEAVDRVRSIPAGFSFRYVVIVDSGGASSACDIITEIYRHTSTTNVNAYATTVANP